MAGRNPLARAFLIGRRSAQLREFVYCTFPKVGARALWGIWIVPCKSGVAELQPLWRLEAFHIGQGYPKILVVFN